MNFLVLAPHELLAHIKELPDDSIVSASPFAFLFLSICSQCPHILPYYLGDMPGVNLANSEDSLKNTRPNSFCYDRFFFFFPSSFFWLLWKSLLCFHYKKKKGRKETNSWCLTTPSDPIIKRQLLTLICVCPCHGYTYRH